jgi:hypothetical protein
MDIKIIGNIILLIIILVIIKMSSPDRDSALYILQTYLNYFIYQFQKLFFGESFINTNNIFFDKNVTFSGIKNGYPVAPSFKTPYENAIIGFYENKYPNIPKNIIMHIFHFLQSLVSVNVDNYFSTPSEIIPHDFTDEELNRIKLILLNKLNTESFKFYDFNFEYKPKYFYNSAGKEVDPFVFNINSDIGIIRIFIDIDIRNDIRQNQEYIVINEIKPIKDKQVIFTNQNTYHEQTPPKQNTDNIKTMFQY